MRVCIIHSIFPPYSRGGAEVVVENTARAFADGGHEVFVITCAPFEGWRSFAGKWEEQSVRTPPNLPSERGGSDAISPPARGGVRGGGSSIRIFRFTPFNLFTIFNISKYPPLLRLFWHVLDMFNLHTYLVVRRILREEKPDLVITRNLKGLGYTIPIAIRNCAPKAHPPRAEKLEIRNSAKWFHGLHDLNALHPRGFMEYGQESVIRNPNPAVRMYRVLARLLIGSPDVVIAPSQFVLKEYECAGFFKKSKKVVISNPVAHNPPQPSLTLREGANNNPPLKIRGGAGGVMKFLYIGQLEPYKGLRVLLQAWRQFVATHPQATLEIVGQGSMEEELKRTAGMIPGIALRGFIPHDKLESLYVGARATILPSLAYETFGMSAAESLAHGVPVICSRIGALPEIVQDGVNGLLVPPGSAAELTQAMEHITQIKLTFHNFTPFTITQYRDALERL